MLATDLTLTGDAGSTQTYSLVSITDGSSIRVDPTAAAGSPKAFIVKNTNERQGKIVAKRHLVRLDRTVADAITGEAVTASVYLVLVNPTRISTSAMVKDMLTQLRNFCGVGANVDKILAGEP